MKGSRLLSYLFNGYNWDLSDPQSIPNLLFTQLQVTFISMAIALLIAFPVALLVARQQRLYLPVITLAGIIYTIPSLAFLAFLVPITFLSDPTLIIPLVLYAQVVLIRNFVAAFRAVDPELVEVGRAMGMNRLQLQLRVVLPLALPVIIAGIRVTMVTTIGIATFGYLVGVDTLGFLIGDGISSHYPDEIIAGSILVSLVAIVADLLLLWLQSFLARGRQIVPAA